MNKSFDELPKSYKAAIQAIRDAAGEDTMTVMVTADVKAYEHGGCAVEFSIHFFSAANDRKCVGVYGETLGQCVAKAIRYFTGAADDANEQAEEVANAS